MQYGEVERAWYTCHDVNKKWPKFADLKARFCVLFKQLEEKKEDGFSDQCSETTCKTRKEDRRRRVW